MGVEEKKMQKDLDNSILNSRQRKLLDRKDTIERKEDESVFINYSETIIGCIEDIKSKLKRISLFDSNQNGDNERNLVRDLIENLLPFSNTSNINDINYLKDILKKYMKNHTEIMG